MRGRISSAATILAILMLLRVARVAGAQDVAPLSDRDFFDNQVLQTIQLIVNPRDWDELKSNYQLNTYYASHFIWRNRIVKNVGIRSRGTGSRSAHKPGLRVDFNLYDTTQDFLGLKSVVLRNNVQDASNLHERLGMRLFERMGLPASREAFARLYVNGEYAGLYSIVESVDKVFLGKHFNQDGGYLYEYEYDVDDRPYRFEYRGPDPALYSPKPFKPVTHEVDPDPRPIADMVRTIKEASNRDFPALMASYLDLRQFALHTAIETFMAETDGVLGEWGMNNFYIYRFEKSTQSALIPWDKSEAFKGGPTRSIWRNIDDVPSWLQNVLMTRTMLVPEYRGVYLDTLLACAAVASAPEIDATEGQEDGATTRQLQVAGAQENGVGERPGWLEREIRRGYDQIRDAVLEDSAKPFSNDEFEEEVRRLVEFARERSAFVENEVRRSPR